MHSPYLSFESLGGRPEEGGIRITKKNRMVIILALAVMISISPVIVSFHTDAVGTDGDPILPNEVMGSRELAWSDTNSGLDDSPYSKMIKVNGITYTTTNWADIGWAFANPGTDEMMSAAESAASVWSGEGTEADPYLINNAEELAFLSEAVNSGNDFTDTYFLMTADIDLGVAPYNMGWTPIGNSSSSFRGIFDGGSHVINNLTVISTDNYAGLFGRIADSGVVKDLGIDENSTVGGRYYVGGVVGYNLYGTVTNCYNTGSVSGTNSVGGVVGDNYYGTLTNCFNTGSVSGDSNVGGVVGYFYGTVANCYNTGSVGGNLYVGGVVGYFYGTLTNCYNTGSVSSTNYYVGGVAGQSTGGTVEKCYYNEETGPYNGFGIGLTTPQMTADAVLTDVMSDLGSAFEKRINDANLYYPELAVFKNSADPEVQEASRLSVIAMYDMFTVTFVDWDGGLLSEQTVAFGGWATAPADPFREGYTFTGWDTDFSDVSSDLVVAALYAMSIVLVDGVSLDKTDITLEIETSEMLTATVSPSDATNKNVIWSSEDESVATVDAYGNVTAVGAGTAIITVTTEDGGFTASCDVTVTAPAADWPGRGTETDPYLINNAEDLAKLSEAVNGGNAFAGKYFLVTANIDLGVAPYNTGWTPIGNGSNPFRGIFNGGGHVIQGLTINGTDYYVGLFGYIGNGGVVKDLIIDENSFVRGSNNVGSVAGYSEGTVADCCNMGSVRGSNYVGGVVGYNLGVITDCCNTGLVSYGYFAGGVTGYNGGTVTNCYNAGSISGGIYHVGGVAGQNYGTVANCYNAGSVVGTGYYVGGVAGSNFYLVTNCYNTGSVAGMNDVGGVVGNNYFSTVSNCYNAGSVVGTNSVGGVVGRNSYSTVGTCYYNTDTYAGPDNGFGTGLTTAQMTADDVLAGSMSGLGPAFEKRENDADLYYPELAVFKNSADPEAQEASRLSVIAAAVNVSVEGVSVDKESMSLTIGSTGRITATVLPEDATDKSVAWSSDDTSVATVDENGIVTAIGAGTAVITVTTAEGGYTATCVVNVAPSIVNVDGVSLDMTSLSLIIGDSVALTATVSPEDATDKSVIWFSVEGSIASVNGNGFVTAVGIGTTAIFVKTNDGNYVDLCIVTVAAAGNEEEQL